MQHYPQSIQKLIRSLAKLPGVGEKTAERLANHILRRPLNEAEQLARSILTMKQNVRLCSRCFGLSDGEYCRICQDPSRNTALLCVVEQPADMISIEKSGAFNGLYFILGGALSPMDGIGPDDLRIKELMTRVRAGEISEVILATGTSVEGESTAAFLADHLNRIGVCVSRIASGVPVGGDLQYIDKMTLKCALDSRREM
jgi:recombination protein RecR